MCVPLYMEVGGGGESLTSDSGLVVAVKGDFSDL